MTRTELRATGIRFIRNNGEEYTVIEHGEINCTLLAESIAHAYDHDEWLDNPEHDVWDISLDLPDAYHDQRMCAV